MPLKKATISIQGIEESCEIKNSDVVAIFTISLKKGKTNLQAWFSDGDNAYTSAYYIEIYLI
ncbi:hypothetical protein [Clostridium grantii]|uniref:Uncharacterized protein n=1 Tax=Clostridium grantii DSM 8605 TaxID=1121316 RepID=A0A1M5U3D1_9CLOT|nr:hypothetical protein [Clostridium grantii]SHH57469.1 hypothetical protein SAMN02745207_01553 [Clostridium grantii DSM 8605]